MTGPQRPLAVALIHGIRTNAEWTRMVSSELLKDPSIQVVRPLGYGYYNVLLFLCPVVTRSFPLREIHEKLRTLEREHRDKDLCVIAHSFGTYLFSKILARDSNLEMKRVILCGSVVRRRFNWSKIRRQITSRPLLNECGSRDPWPVLAHRATFGYGPTGTFGFSDASIHDRFHQFAHSDYFDGNFVRADWVPFIARGQTPAPTAWEQSPKNTPPLWLRALARIPIQWLLIGLLVWWLGERLATRFLAG